MSVGSATSSWRWSGYQDRPTTALAIERVVVSFPANVNSKKKAAICSSSRKCSVPVSSIIGVVMIVLMRSSPRFLRRFLVSSNR